jgi:diguanylate cyclase (GGDEF)-like protein/PAS domain S-box-containing protein
VVRLQASTLIADQTLKAVACHLRPMTELNDPQVFRTVLEGLDTGVYILDRERRILFWNQGAEKITGYHSHEVMGHLSRQSILSQCDDLKCVLCGNACPLSGSILDGKRKEIEISLQHKSGHRVPVRLQVIPIRGGHGSVIGAAGSFVEENQLSDVDIHLGNLATHGCLDTLTGTPNQAFTHSHLRENLSFFREYNLPFGVLFIELEKLDELHATHGREAVDVMLHVVAQTMKHTLRPDGFLGHWSENQFLAILTYCESRDLEKAAQSVERMVNCSGVQWWADLLTVSASVGRTMVREGDTIESLLERAQQRQGQALAKKAVATGGETNSES